MSSAGPSEQLARALLVLRAVPAASVQRPREASVRGRARLEPSGNAVAVVVAWATVLAISGGSLAHAQARAALPQPTAADQAGSAVAHDEGWILELGLGGANKHDPDAYTHRLFNFGFREEHDQAWRWNVAFGRRLQSHFVVGLAFGDLEDVRYSRHSTQSVQRFLWSGQALAAWLQVDAGGHRARVINVFARLGAGLAFATTGFDAPVIEAANADAMPGFLAQPPRTHRVYDTQLSPYAVLGIGFAVTPDPHAGLQLEVRQSVAPTLQDRLGDLHDLGEVSALLSLRLRTWE